MVNSSVGDLSSHLPSLERHVSKVLLQYVVQHDQRQSTVASESGSTESDLSSHLSSLDRYVSKVLLQYVVQQDQQQSTVASASDSTESVRLELAALLKATGSKWLQPPPDHPQPPASASVGAMADSDDG